MEKKKRMFWPFPVRRHRRIVLVGLLHDENLGDPAIFEMTRYFIKEYCRKHRLDVTLKYIDIGTYKVPRFRSAALAKQYDSLMGRLYRVLFKRPFTKYDRVKLSGIRLIKRWTDAVVFVGGSVIKFKQQEFLHRMIGIILDRSDRVGVPVMFSGAGLEGYDDNSEACRDLRADLNRKCVRVITVRDDIDTLRNCYLRGGNESIRAEKVSDAACSLYRLHPPVEREKDTIGIGVIRSDIFTEYGRPVSDECLLRLYADIYERLLERGKRCLIFTNGARRDQAFAERLVSRLGVEGNAAGILCPRPKTVAELIEHITRCEAVVATRLHSSIIAYAYAIPSVGLVWNRKQCFFGESIGCPDRFFDTSEFDADKIVAKLLSAMEAGYPGDGIQSYKDSNAKELERFLDQYL